MGNGDREGRASADASAEEAKEVLRMLRKCRSRLNSLNMHHAAAYADISVQLLKQAIANQDQETGQG